MNALAPTALRLLASVLAGAALFTLGSASSAYAQVMLKVPGEGPGVPAYARVERPFTFHTSQYAAIVFYRDPACVPPGFNLLAFFDAPAAFDCVLTVSGFEIWESGPSIDLGPRHAISSGLSVPVWFVPWPAFQAAIADDVLTLSELEGLNPLKGVAKTFHEVLNPFVPPGAPGGAHVPHLTVSASGSLLDDGRSFQYQYTDVFVGGERKSAHVRIVFR